MADITEDTIAESLAQDTELTETDKLALLKSQADLLETLQKKIKAKRDELDTGEQTVEASQIQTEETGESPHKRRMRLIREANSLVRCRISCMNPAKKDWPGEIFTVSNAVVGTVR